jgi:hypothetical protein
MADVDINDVAMIGVIDDVKPYNLPPEAWTLALNMRYRDKAIETLLGWEQVFGTPPVAPYFLLPISTLSTNYWIYAGLTKIYVYDGASHADISRTVGGAYTATSASQFNGTILGGIPIINNGVDIPQYRADMAAATEFENLPNWDSTRRARIIRAFGPFLMAFGITDSGTPQPHSILWSHPADPGSVPPSWDETDLTRDTGLKDLEDVNSGVIVDALPLQSTMYVYKETSTWRVNYIGGRVIFDFKTLFEESGILAPRCVGITGDGRRHFVVTQDDVIWHNGNKVVSVGDKRSRSRLFGEIDTVNYENSFVFSNRLYNEMWFCYPTKGSSVPNAAMIWNYGHGGEEGVLSFADGITFQHAAIGNLEGDSDELWSDGTDEWDEDTGPWSEFTRRRVIVASPQNTKIFVLDRGSTRDGTSFTQTLQRQGLSITGRKRNGEWIVDHQKFKMLQSLWPKIVGDAVDIRFGAQELVDGPLTWGPAVAFDPSVSRQTDNDPIEGTALALEFASSSKSWKMDGYKLSLVITGQY